MGQLRPREERTLAQRGTKAVSKSVGRHTGSGSWSWGRTQVPSMLPKDRNLRLLFEAQPKTLQGVLRSCPNKPRPLGAKAPCPQLPPERSSEAHSLPLPFIDTLPEPGMRPPPPGPSQGEVWQQGWQEPWGRRGFWLFSLTYCANLGQLTPPLWTSGVPRHLNSMWYKELRV